MLGNGKGFTMITPAFHLEMGPNSHITGFGLLI
jgi:hypothetical protein